MKVSPIKTITTNAGNQQEKTAFKGRTETYYGDKNYHVNGFAHSPNWHSDSSVEQTLNSYHSDRKGKIYFADPMEPISDAKKMEVDFIVYDNEPAYPDVNEEISKNYFGTERINYRKKFENIRDYFYRREQGGWADKAEAQYQQWQAAECIRLYDKGGHLRYEKEQMEDENTKAEQKIKQNEQSISLTIDLIKQKEAEKAKLEKEINAVENKNKLYSALKKELAEPMEDNTKEEKDFVSAILLTGSAALVAKNNNINKIKQNIKNLKSRIETLQADIVKNKEIIKQNLPKIADTKAKLIPLFDELKHFYMKQGIKKF